MPKGKGRFYNQMKNLRRKAKLVLEDGRVFEGFSFAGEGTIFGEVVFNTAMTGYQEIITDPSYKGQIVTMTYPLIGNYGVNAEDVETFRPFLEGFIVKEYSELASNWRAKMSLRDYLCKYNILGIEGIDTRALTRHIRLEGAMKAVISTEDLNEKSLLQKVKASPGLVGRDLVKEVTSKKIRQWEAKGRYKVVVIDCGTKFNILRELAKCDCQVITVPAYTSKEEILKLRPDGVLISNGPGDPAPLTYLIETVRGLLERLPLFGICLGQQILGLALGGRTYKLKFGHHGVNHPVRDLRKERIAITVQNHGFCVDIDSLDKEKIEITHINLNDYTLEGLCHKERPIFSVQFHPEASAGPNDARYLFRDFVEMIERFKSSN